MPPSVRERFSRAVAHPLAYGGRLAVAAVAAVPLYGVRWEPLPLIGLAAALPLALLLLDPPFRRRQVAAAAELWADLSRPSAEWRPWWAGVVFVAAPAALFYLAHPYYNLASGDSWATLPAALSVLRDGDTEVSEFVATAPDVFVNLHQTLDWLPYGTMRLPGGVYSRYPVGMSAFALPTGLMGWACGADFDSGPVLAALERLAAVSVAVLVLVLFFRVAVALAPPSTALLAAWLLALGSGVNSTVGQALWQHGGVAAGALALLAVEVVPALRRRRWGVAVQGVAVGLMFACRLSSGWLAVVLGLGVFVRSPPRGVAVAVAGALGVLPWAMYYRAVYGTPFGPSQAQMALSDWRQDILHPLLGVLASPARGLLVYQPWVVLSAIGFALRCRTSAAWVLAVAAAGHTVLVASWVNWWGGACWGSRLLAEIQPLLMLLALPALARLQRGRSGRAVLIALFLWSAAAHLASVWRLLPDVPWDHADGQTMWLPARLVP